MKRYRVLLNVEHFHMKTEQGAEWMGFYVHRVVEAENRQEAERKAVDCVRQDQLLKDKIFNLRDDEPKLHVEEIKEVEQGEEMQYAGYGFYSEEE